MAHSGNRFRDALIEEIHSWNLSGVHVYREVFVGSRFVGKKRKLDLVIQHNNRTLGIEAKYQGTSGTAYQKLNYALEDARRTPIETIIVFAGAGIEEDVKALLISSGIGIELQWNEDAGFTSGIDIFRQRILIELQLDWLSDQERNRVF